MSRFLDDPQGLAEVMDAVDTWPTTLVRPASSPYGPTVCRLHIARYRVTTRSPTPRSKSVTSPGSSDLMICPDPRYLLRRHGRRTECGAHALQRVVDPGVVAYGH